MGRTKRTRWKRKVSERTISISNELATIHLTKWLVQKNWRNDNRLRLRNFPHTGRGVTSLSRIKENDILITVPYNLMITYDTLQENLQEMISPCSHGLKIHDLLTLFLVTEKQKENSLWKAYLDSLPSELPVLPWLATSEEINLYPADMQVIIETNLDNFKESLCRVKQSIKKHDGCVLDENLFKWGYVLVNTRAVYVDPEIATTKGYFWGDLLIDQPNMALCPFLDMFNHHFLAKTEARVIRKGGELVYQLLTLTKHHERHEQIFISYGSHDNIKLLMEYGFFIPGNTLDVVKFDLKNILNVFKINLNQRQYKFILHHKFNSYLYIGYSGVSFNLKALLFVLFQEHCQNYSAIIFSGTYPENYMDKLTKWAVQLLDCKLEVFENEYRMLKDCCFIKSDNARLMEAFLKYRIDLINDLKNKVIYI